MLKQIDPAKITDFNRTNEELELFLLFCVCVAGKTAKTISYLLAKFLENNDRPFDYIRKLIKNSQLENKIKKSGLGQHNKLIKAFTQIVNGNLNLRTVTVEELEKIHGIGLKTSRFFIVHSRKTNEYAIIDRHILKYLKNDLNLPNIPKDTPTKKKYLELEKVFIQHAEDKRMDINILDLKIWNSYSKGGI